MYTFEMYPDPSTSLSRFYPPDEVISRETTRNKTAVFYLIDVAGCVYTPIGKKQTHCGPFNDDIEISRGWQVNPLGNDTATSGRWQRADPSTTNYQSGTATSGRYDLVTGASAGSTSSANDVDGGRTSVRSPAVALPSAVGKLTFRYYLAHASNASSADTFQAFVEETDGTRTLVKSESGAANTDRAAWASASVSLTAWAGETIRIVFVATDGGPIRWSRPPSTTSASPGRRESHGQADPERGAGTPRRLDHQLPAVGLDEMTGDRQTEA